MVNDNLATKKTPKRLPFSGEYRPAGFLRRIGALVYDGFLMSALLFFAHIPLQLLFGTTVISSENPWHFVYQLYLLGVCFWYFGWCWTRGQTLGMRAWRIYLQGENGVYATWWQAWIRFLSAMVSLAAFGLGFLWALVDREHKSWHDRLSGTILIFSPPRPKSQP
uniref:Uncharacterized membrane protein YckC, RDD family n=1 Tax=Candidatus Kentrum sp. MB TaxID=2138164 RepID=A0A450XN78_9GAMM|nr:MAG: Uncharacterized membrane protein YckC, RDD family [Candidatus Kentron sp. MB]VFK30775.1 MAG: Uncharacterized membrane protein YckC, RDD family [Candidatus Kentron sp. MB]VFK75228.1 MAG: Uncharacterized membrane protein YckC, RDD family [Candidatus Kentron sp. MB]